MNIFKEVYGIDFEDFDGNLNEEHLNRVYTEGMDKIINLLHEYIPTVGDNMDCEGNYISDELYRIIKVCKG
jgi:hypothetical protein